VFESAGLAVRAVVVAPDGAIYFCTDTALGRLELVR
jgi:glucose/arabinose dehydrogenase